MIDYSLVVAKIDLAITNCAKVRNFVTLDVRSNMGQSFFTHMLKRHITKPIFLIKGKPDGRDIRFSPPSEVISAAIEDSLIKITAIVCNHSPLRSLPIFKRFYSAYIDIEGFAESETASEVFYDCINHPVFKSNIE
ncbi:MAG: hypothetical protein V2I33_23975 [Kangiellaceae bacterium]|nr:hypothetical protein [Kangiellaceae bacterium]